MTMSGEGVPAPMPTTSPGALPPDLTPLILQGHVLDVLRTLPDSSVQCVVTSPPYWGLRAYGTEPQVWGGEPGHAHEWAEQSERTDDTGWERRRGSLNRAAEATDGNPRAATRTPDVLVRQSKLCLCGAWHGELGLEPTPELYVDHLASVFDEVRRVLRDDGTLWLNLGDTYASKPVGSYNGETGLPNRDLSYRPASGAIDKVVASGLREKNLIGIPWRVAFELQRRGWWLRAENIWAKPNPMPESVTDRPTRSHEQVFLLTKRARYFYDGDAVRVGLSEWSEKALRSDWARRSDAKLASERNDRPLTAKGESYKNGLNPAGANLKSVWWIPTEPYPAAHFATFPSALAETALLAGTSEKGACVTCGAPWEREVEVTQEIRCETNGGTGRPRAGFLHAQPVGQANSLLGSKWSKKGGMNEYPATIKHVATLGFSPGCSCGAATVPCLVLDPFCGSGTVLQVARSLGLRSIGIDLKPEYVDLAVRRSRADVPDLTRWHEPGEAA